ncbi:tetratricopeptide repeat protein [bacterium]|nr:tetratricopeptide repeat protein [bacterium]MBQ9149564.1 tetratricopeptide repeat protein [bacterium]
MFKRFYVCLFFMALLGINNVLIAGENENIADIKEQAIALYTTGNYNEAFKLLDNLPTNEKNEEIFLLLANIAQENNKDNLAIQNLNKALDKNYSFYKAYYNLGCIFASKKSYLLASNNFELAIKYNKDFPSSYYNLACCQIKLKNFEAAKKNLIKAIDLNPSNKDYYYNLAYCYKELHKEKQAKKILEAYNKMS